MSWDEIYIVQVLEYTSPIGTNRHLIIERRDGQEIVSNWDLLQKIKNETLGEDVLAVEFFPEEYKVVNEINRRHLWEINREYLPIGF